MFSAPRPESTVTVQSQMRRSPAFATATRPCQGGWKDARDSTSRNATSLDDSPSSCRVVPAGAPGSGTPKTARPAAFSCNTRPCASTSAIGRGLAFTIAAARCAASRLDCTAWASSMPLAMCAATAVQ